MFTTVLFIIAQNWKLPKYLLTLMCEQLKKKWHMEYAQDKKNGL